jgi:hypothetical protein
MRFIARTLMFSVSLAATFAHAQTIPAGTFKHIIIVVQENRTPDNIFGSAPSTAGEGCGTEDAFEPGVDIHNGGPASGKGIQCSISLPMNVGSPDPNHSHKNGWVPQYDSGGMDGFCQIVKNGVCEVFVRAPHRCATVLRHRDELRFRKLLL